MKSQLKQISSILQYLSFETIENMLYQMKTLQLAKIQTEFIMLTMYHGQQVRAKLDTLDLKPEVKIALLGQIEVFVEQLLDISKFEHDFAAEADLIK